MSFFGDAPQTTVHQAPGTPAAKPPGFQFARWLFDQLPGLMGTPFPTYQGQLDPGLSPTLADTIRRAQGYAASSPPEILAGAQGSLGRFMNPRYRNPFFSLFQTGGSGAPGGAAGGGGNPWAAAGASSMFGGAPNYFGVRGGQTVYGGKPASAMTWDLGSPNGAPPQLTPSTPGGNNDFVPLWLGAGGG